MKLMPGCGATSTGKIVPGILAAKATMPGWPAAVYSLMKIEPPATARLKTPPRPPPPPAWVEVLIWMDAVIHESSPDSEKTTSPGSSATSRTGMTVPTTFASILGIS